MSKVKLGSLKPGDAFIIPGTKLGGVVVAVNECRVLVKTAATPKIVSFADRNGEVREFVAESAGLASWAPGAEVEKTHEAPEEINQAGAGAEFPSISAENPEVDAPGEDDEPNRNKG